MGSWVLINAGWYDAWFEENRRARAGVEIDPQVYRYGSTRPDDKAIS